jgi:hypothetical protein
MSTDTTSSTTTTTSAKPKSHGLAWLPLAGLLAADVGVFVLQKGASAAEAKAQGWEYLLEVVRSPLMWLAIGLTPLQLWLWTVTLRRSDLGWAYPVTALAYPITMLIAYGVFHEHYSWHVWLGAGLITAGAGVLGPPEKTEHRTDKEAS